MAYTCIQCNSAEAQDEYTRCPSCEARHKELCAKLDAKPKQHIEKVREELFPIYEVKQGIKVTTWISREDAANMGIDITNKEPRMV